MGAFFPGGWRRISAVRRWSAAGAVAALVLSACTTGSVLSLEPAVDVGATASVARHAMVVPSIPEPDMASPETPMSIGFPRLQNPLAPAAGLLPPDEASCRRDLKRLGVVYTDLAPIREGQCGIDHPVKVAAIGSVQMKPAATLSCDMAASFAAWTKSELVPAARWRYWSSVKAIRQGSSYSCRNIAGKRTLSEHGKGNALDVMAIELNNGDTVDVRKPGLFSFRARGFLNTVRADGCSYFNTVLGPGYNHDHRDHFHFDIKSRRNGYRACR